MKHTDLLILDIDGCLVRSFDGKGLNQGAFAEKCKMQPINQPIHDFIKQFYESYPDYLETHVFTGRKKSLLYQATMDHLEHIAYCLNAINFYPEELAYDPLSIYHNWKLNAIDTLIRWKQPKRVFVLEDDIRLVSQILSPIPFAKIEFWIVVKDSFVCKSNKVSSIEELNSGVFP